MKEIGVINTQLPTVESFADYHSGETFADYDIIVFNPELPYESRVEFTGGGSCISIEGTRKLKSSMSHWRKEITDALSAGKTIFFLLGKYKEDQAASSSSMPKKGSVTYNTSNLNNYEVLPTPITLRNAKGKNFVASDNSFSSLYESLKEVAGYQCLVSSEVTQKIFTTKDGVNTVGAVLKVGGLSGHLVLLPYFDLSQMFYFDHDKGTEMWTDDALRISHAIVNQMISVDSLLKSGTSITPKPEWFDQVIQPKQVSTISEKIEEIDKQILGLEEQKLNEITSQNELLHYSGLLYENGQPLELAIENSLKLLGYAVKNFRDGDFEIDHVIESPEGKRLIGESEGRDNAAIGISKFRQLESNINEDFEREDTTEPAKGILFGNGFRLTEPSARENQFSQKCLTNAKRLGTALIKTTDLYDVVVYVLDNPSDKKFKEKCRKAIESTNGDVVVFPKPTKK